MSSAPSPLDNTSRWMRSAWHAVALSDEIGDAPSQVWLLGQPWVLVRLDGTVRAFADVCPHRLAPLSGGKSCPEGGISASEATSLISGDLSVDDLGPMVELQCGYHGWRFDGTGRCVAIPALASSERIPARADLKPAHGVIERYGLVWIAPDEPLSDIPDLAEWENPSFDRAFTEVIRTPVSAGQLVDNFLDASHFPFVHNLSFGVDESAEVVDDGVVREGWVVRTNFSTWYRNDDDPLVATGEHDPVQPQDLLKQGSAALTVLLRLYFPVTESTLTILFCCQPETATSTRVYKLIVRDDFAGDTDLMDGCIRYEDQVTREDLEILEQYPEMILHLDPRVEMHTKADRLSLQWRRLLVDMKTHVEGLTEAEMAETSVAL